MVTLTPRSCVARQEPYIPGALSILPGTVPGQVRGLGHMVPTYFRRELRDRALQRPSRLRTSFSRTDAGSAPPAVAGGAKRRPSTRRIGQPPEHPEIVERAFEPRPLPQRALMLES